jgi:hypothetical protein
MIKSVSVGGFLGLLILAFILMSGKNSPKTSFSIGAAPAANAASPDGAGSKLVLMAPVATTVSAAEKLKAEAMAAYDSMNLKKFGLSKKAFEYAWKGYRQLREKGKLKNTDIISICDFSQSSRRKRLYVLDIDDMKVLVNTYVAHGRNSGAEYARSFSNQPESHKSSLGFYVTRNTYFGQHGLALRIDGLERGINDKANARNIVVHGSNYVGDKFLRSNPFNGRSFGCPAIPERYKTTIINTIKNGTCLFIYHPTPNYLKKSRILNG